MNVLATRKVLVLNRGWNPVAIVPLKRALCIVWGAYNDGEPKARILDPTQDFQLFSWEDWSKFRVAEEEAALKSGHSRHRIPEIILLSRYNRLPQQRIHYNRRTIFKRDGYQCQYCGKKPGTSELNIDHVTPRAKNGLTTWENVVVSCVACNSKKANRTMEEAGMKFFHPGYKPFKPKFTLFKDDYRCKSWESVIGACYWNCELQNDMNT